MRLSRGSLGAVGHKRILSGWAGINRAREWIPTLDRPPTIDKAICLAGLTLREGQRVSFTEGRGPKGPCAENVTLA